MSVTWLFCEYLVCSSVTVMLNEAKTSRPRPRPELRGWGRGLDRDRGQSLEVEAKAEAKNNYEKSTK